MTHRVPWLTLLPGGHLHAPPPLTPPRLCLHQEQLIDVEARWLECATCGMELDPYVLLAAYADEETRLTALRRQISMDLTKGVLACVRCGAKPPETRL